MTGMVVSLVARPIVHYRNRIAQVSTRRIGSIPVNEPLNQRLPELIPSCSFGWKAAGPPLAYYQLRSKSNAQYGREDVFFLLLSVH